MDQNEPPFYPYSDIEHPENKKIRDHVYKKLGVENDIDYDDFCQKFGFITRKELLELAKKNKW